MVVLLNTIGAREALYAYVTLNERLATEVSTIRRCDEWHVDIGKSRRENEMGEKGLTCSDGFDYEPIFGKEAQQCVFLTTDGFANK